MPSHPTVLLPDRPGKSSASQAELPADLLQRAAFRLRWVALVYAAAFFMANFVSSFLAGEIAAQFRSFIHWGPGVISIALSLVVYALTFWRRIPPATLMTVGSLFSVVGSYGIAAAEYLGTLAAGGETVALKFSGLSWVAVWMVTFSIIVPHRPRIALLAALGSATAVPVTVLLGAQFADVDFGVTKTLLFVGLVFPYLICAMMAFFGARTVYRLGHDVRRAREYGSYHLVELLGRGGMGEVWRAEHHLLARPAAIKLIRPEALRVSVGDGPSTGLQRFEREAQTTAALCSPHTVELYDYGISDGQSLYYVMELLKGLDLHTLIDRHGPIPAARTSHFMIQVCHSLGEAHEQGLVHRDIKPANIFACRYGREVDFIKVLDFGLVKAQHTKEKDPGLTAAHQAGGTPAFMAPEQILGDRAIDGRADLYALGCVGYWLLTGQLVFDAETPMKTMMLHTHEAPVPPSVRSETAIPLALDEIVLSCLAKDPADRPPSADALRQALLQSDLPTWEESDSEAWWRLHVPEAMSTVPTAPTAGAPA